jgi:hypothetical protein
MLVTDVDARTFCGIPEGDPVLPLIHRSIEKDIEQFLGWNPERRAYTRTYPKGEPGGRDDYFVGAYGVIPRAGGTTDVLQLDHKYVLDDGILNVQECAGAYYGKAPGTTWQTLTKGQDFVLEVDQDESSDGGHVSRSGHLIRMGTEWPKSRGSVKVTYTAGFTATELSGIMGGEADYTNASDIKLAVLQSIGRAYNQAKMHQYSQATGRPGGLVSSESIDGYSYSLDGAVAQATMGLGMTLPPEVQARLQKYRKYGSLLG